MITGRANFSFVAFNACLYALGGHNTTSSELTTEKYDPTENKWIKFPSMDAYSSDLNAEVMNDKIFVIGGYYEANNFGVKYFNDKENRWNPVTNVNVRRTLMSTCVIKNLPNASDYS
ncbi:Kelch-like protein 10 [Zootermopsis nevadensis]|uniref:Kelch-like protein 10 n=2 Tax=Zootermopsis nevadensis TaxID=136037 RepID=A0A067QRB1_ZOONE|nr:Kelch-like protein 10 [Zootermopsis nevadensis]